MISDDKENISGIADNYDIAWNFPNIPTYSCNVSQSISKCNLLIKNAAKRVGKTISEQYILLK